MSDIKSGGMELKVLIVDDDVNARHFLGSALRAAGCYEIQEVSKADQVMDACDKYQPHVVFLDIDLGGVNGLDVMRYILEERPKQYFVVVSAHNTMDNVKRALSGGARGFIVKPFTAGKVQEAYTNALEHFRAKK